MKETNEMQLDGLKAYEEIDPIRISELRESRKVLTYTLMVFAQLHRSYWEEQPDNLHSVVTTCYGLAASHMHAVGLNPDDIDDVMREGWRYSLELNTTGRIEPYMRLRLLILSLVAAPEYCLYQFAVILFAVGMTLSELDTNGHLNIEISPLLLPAQLPHELNVRYPVLHVCARAVMLNLNFIHPFMGVQRGELTSLIVRLKEEANRSATSNVQRNKLPKDWPVIDQVAYHLCQYVGIPGSDSTDVKALSKVLQSLRLKSGRGDVGLYFRRSAFPMTPATIALHIARCTPADLKITDTTFLIPGDLLEDHS